MMIPSWQEETNDTFISSEGVEKEDSALHGGKEKAAKL